MGSIGVNSDRGAVTGSQLSDVLNIVGQMNAYNNQVAGMPKALAEANSLVIYPNNYTSSESLKKSLEKWQEALGLGKASRGYAIAMTGATVAQKAAFINALKKSLNLTQNSEAKMQARVDKAIEKATAWAKQNGRTSLTAIEKRAITETVRSTYQREQIDKIIARDRANGNKLFGGNIRTRNLRKTDF